MKEFDISTSSDQDVHQITFGVAKPWKDIYKDSILRTIPVILAATCMNSDSTFNLYLLGQSSSNTSVIAGFGLGNSFYLMISVSVYLALNSGLNSRVAQLYGAQEFVKLGITVQRAYFINFVICIPITLMMIYSEHIFNFLQFNPAVIPYASRFLLFLSPGPFLTAIYTTLASALSGCGYFYTVSAIQVASAIIYYPAAYVLIEVYDLGVAGSGLASCCLYLTNAIIFIAYLKIKNPIPKAIVRPKRPNLKKTWDFFEYECVVGSMNFLDVVFNQIITLFTGGLSSPLQEGFTIGANIYRLVLPVAQGFASTTLTFTGISMGETNFESAKQYVKAGFVMALAVVCAYEGFFFLFRTQIINIFLNNPDALSYTETAFNILVLAGIAEALQLTLASGLKGIGKEKSGAFVVCLVNLTMIPLGYVFCFVFEWYEVGLCSAIVLTMVLKFLMYSVVYCRLDWEKQVKVVAKTLKFITNQADTTIFEGSINFSFIKPQLDEDILEEKDK